MPTPLSVSKIISGAFWFVWVMKWRMLRALIIPATAIFILKFSPYLINWVFSSASLWDNALFRSVDVIIQTAFYILFAITCHRLALIGNQSVPEYGMLSWTKRESNFLIWLFVVSIAGGITYQVISLPLLNISEASENNLGESYYLAYIPTLYILSRLSLLYPATAVDRQVDLRWAWRLSKNNGWRLTIVVGFLPMFFVYLTDFLLRENATWIEYMIFQILGFIILAVEIVALSFSYKHLTESQVVEAEG